VSVLYFHYAAFNRMVDATFKLCAARMVLPFGYPVHSGHRYPGRGFNYFTFMASDTESVLAKREKNKEGWDWLRQVGWPGWSTDKPG
jgi:hypothetical protein